MDKVVDFNQIRLIYEWERDKLNSAYHNIFIFHLSGILNYQALAQAIEFLPKIFPELNSYFKAQEGVWIKEYSPVTYPTVIKDLIEESLTEDDAITLIDKYLHEYFEITAPPLFRHILIKVKDDLSFLGLCWHHLIDDAISVKIMIKKIGELYECISKGRIPEINSVQLPASLGTANYDIKYWALKLQNYSDFKIHLATQKRSTYRKVKSRRVNFELDKILSSKTMIFLGKYQTTLFILSSSALLVLCHHFSGQRQLVIGYSANTRRRHELDTVVGFKVNNLPLCLTFDGSLTFLEIIEQVAQQRQQDYFNQDAPLLEILKAIRQSNPNQKISSLFNILISQYTNISFKLNLENVEAQPIPIINNDPKNDLSLFYDFDDVIKFEVEYRTDLYEDEFIAQLIDSFKIIIQNLVSNPTTPISDVNLLSEEFYKKIVYHWNNNGSSYAYNGITLIDLFKQGLNRAQDNIALIFNDKMLTYTELDLLSDKIANYLSYKASVKTGDIVGLMVGRNIETIPSILGILKIGAVYLPIDPSYPVEKIEYFINDSQPKFIIQTETFCKQNYHLNNLLQQFKKVESYKDIIQFLSAESLPSYCNDIPLNAELPCYLIYTSGTSGRPKGVVNNHYGPVNRVMWMVQEYNITSKDIILQKTSYTFDISIWEIFVPLFCGSTIIIADNDSYKDPYNLLKVINQYQISVIHFVPSMLQAFLQFCANRLPVSHYLRLIACSGEKLPQSIVKMSKRIFSDVKLLNLYGPTEASIEVSYWDCDNSVYTDIIPIGKALPNVRLYLLDEKLKPVPIGVRGELYIGGIAVAKGYLNKESVTLERFLPSIFEKHERIYKTGDMGRWLAGGNIEYLGRIDHQVKFHGYRIELEEIEIAICNYFSIENCSVYYNGNESVQELIAFIVTKDRQAIEQDGLRKFLMTKLPHFMIPKKFVQIEHLPITKHGKVDRNALIQLVPTSNYGKNASNSSNMVDFLYKIWSEVLNIDIKILNNKSNFFALGGDSLSALKVTFKIEETLGMNIPTSLLIDYPDMCQLVEWVSNHLNSGENSETNMNMETQVTHKTKDCSQTNLYNMSLIQKNLLKSGNNNIVIPIKWCGSLNISILDLVIASIIERHPLLNIKFTADGKFYFIDKRPITELIEFQDLSNLNESHKQYVIREKYSELLELDPIKKDAPLFIVRYFALQNNNYTFLYYFHHSIVDHASIQLFFKEFKIIYNSHNIGSPYELSVPGSYEVYVNDEKSFIYSQNYINQLQYFISIFKNKKRLIFDNYKEVNASCSYYEEILTEKEAASIEKLIQNYRKSPFVILLAIFRITLAQFIKDHYFTIGFMVSKRNKLKYENTFGPILTSGAILFANSIKQPLLDQLDNIDMQLTNIHKYSSILDADIISKLRVEENNPNAELFNVFFDYEHNLFLQGNINNIEISQMGILHSSQMRRYISFRISREPENYLVGVRYRNNLFNASEITEIVSSYKKVLYKEAQSIS